MATLTEGDGIRKRPSYVETGERLGMGVPITWVDGYVPGASHIPPPSKVEKDYLYGVNAQGTMEKEKYNKHGIYGYRRIGA